MLACGREGSYLKFLRNLKLGKAVKIILLIAFVLFAAYAIQRFDFEFVRNFIRDHTVLGVFLVMLIYAGLGATPVPSEPVTVFLTGLNGPVWTIFCVTIGNTIASFVEYFIGRQIGDFSDFEKKKESLPFHLNKMPVESIPFQLLGRIIPAVGAKFVGVSSGIYGVNLFTYFWTTVVSNMLGAMLIVFGSLGILKLF